MRHLLDLHYPACWIVLSSVGACNNLAGGLHDNEGTIRMASVDVVDVRKSYGTQEVIHGVSMAIADGEFVILVGPSGCGKSTLLRMIAGLEAITSGDIRIGKRVVNDLPPKDRDIAMVFQTYALYPHKTGAENMGFSWKLRRAPKAEIEKRVRRVAGILDLLPYLSRYPRELSGGQRQRVAMGRAIVRDPKVFLFDEPLSNLDAKLRVQMRAEIKELHQRLKTTTVYVTHDQVEAMTMADKIVVMRDGIVEQVGTPDAIYREPASTFVASFIGAPSMNLAPARIEESGGALLLRLTEAIALPVPPERAARCAAGNGRDVIIGIRPESFAWAAQDEPAAIEIVASVVEPLGSDTLVFFELGGHEMVSRVPPEAVRRAGDRLRLSVDLSRMHLFDPATGRNLCPPGGS